MGQAVTKLRSLHRISGVLLLVSLHGAKAFSSKRERGLATRGWRGLGGGGGSAVGFSLKIEGGGGVSQDRGGAGEGLGGVDGEFWKGGGGREAPLP